jgi:hypothetical protein
MILTALFKLIELLTVKPNRNSRSAKGPNAKQKGEANENLQTHTTGAGDRKGAYGHGHDLRGGEHDHSPAHRWSGRHIRHGLFIPFHDD